VFVLYEQTIIPGKSFLVQGFKHSPEERVAVARNMDEQKALIKQQAAQLQVEEFVTALQKDGKPMIVIEGE
jgi:hypothetical protein